MKMIARPLVASLVALLLLTFTATGCTDNVAGVDEANTPEVDAPASKFRNSSMLDKAGKRFRFGKDGDGRVGLILRFDNAVLDPQKVLKRYKILKRYDFADVFRGAAVTVHPDSVSEMLALMEQDPSIRWFEPDFDFENGWSGEGRPPWAGQKRPWSHAAIGVAPANGRAPQVDVFVIDTGVSSSDINVVEHYLVESRMQTDSGHDVDGHGTHVAGLIGAIDDDDGIVGVAPGVRIHDINVTNDSGTIDLSTAVAAVEYITGFKLANPNAPVVANISLGADLGSTGYSALDEAIDASSSAGVVYVVSAGNEGIDASTVTPAHAAAAITVGSYNENLQFESYSNYGRLLDILAPGGNLTSLDTEADAVDGVAVVMSGTSQAAAHVTGAVALFLADNPNASADAVRSALTSTSSAGVAGTPVNTSNQSLNAGPVGLASYGVPPFLQYAVFGGHDLRLKERVSLRTEGSTLANASIFANHDLEVTNPESVIEGFAYYGHQIKRLPENTLKPRYNPTGLSPRIAASPVDMEAFDAAAFEHLASRSDEKLKLSGHYQLGTIDRPLIWYVDGDLTVEAPTTFSGYGIFLVDGTVDIHAQIGSHNGTVAFYMSDNLKVAEPGVNVTAQFLVGHDAALKGDTVIRGSITVLHDMKLGGPLTLYYRPVPRALADPLWK